MVSITVNVQCLTPVMTGNLSSSTPNQFHATPPMNHPLPPPLTLHLPETQILFWYHSCLLKHTIITRTTTCLLQCCNFVRTSGGFKLKSCDCLVGQCLAKHTFSFITLVDLIDSHRMDTSVWQPIKRPLIK